MRRPAVFLCLLALAMASGRAFAYDRQGMASIGGSFGAASFKGVPDLSSQPRTRLSFRGITKYQLDNHFRLTGSVGYAWNSYLGALDPGTKETLDTLLVISPLELGMEYSFGPDYRPSRPYAGLQMGLYRWEFVSNEPFGVRHIVRDVAAAQDLDHSYFGYGFNLGEEYHWRDVASVTAELGYHHVKSNDVGRYNTPFSARFRSALSVLELRAGMNFYFSVIGAGRRRSDTGPSVSAAPAQPDTGIRVPTTAKPEIQKETLQIVPEAVQQERPGTVTPSPAVVPSPAATPPAPAPASSVSPAPAAQPVDTSAAKAAPPPAAPDTAAKAAPPAAAPDTTAKAAPPAAAPDTSAKIAPPAAAPDTTAKVAPPAAAPDTSAKIAPPPAPAVPDSSGQKESALPPSSPQGDAGGGSALSAPQATPAASQAPPAAPPDPGTSPLAGAPPASPAAAPSTAPADSSAAQAAAPDSSGAAGK